MNIREYVYLLCAYRRVCYTFVGKFAVIFPFAVLLFAAACGGKAALSGVEGQQAPLCPGCNIILVSLDTLRADSLGTYGYHRDTSPNLDRLARKGVVFLNTYSQAPNTFPSHMSIFTSQYCFGKIPRGCFQGFLYVNRIT